MHVDNRRNLSGICCAIIISIFGFIDSIKAQMALEGTWIGRWGGISETVLIFKQIDAQTAEITYIYKGGGEYPARPPSKRMVTVSGNQFEWTSQNGSVYFWFRLDSDGMLLGQRQDIGNRIRNLRRSDSEIRMVRQR